jgi:hypothetical protein
MITTIKANEMLKRSVYRSEQTCREPFALFLSIALSFSCFTGLNFATAATYYCDPNGNTVAGDGSASNPWGTLESVTGAGYFDGSKIKAGDTVKLNAGFHGSPSFINRYTDYVEIEPNGTAVVKLNHIEISYSSYFHFKGLQISPDYNTPSNVTVHLPSSNPSIIHGYSDDHITVEDCYIFTIEDASGWGLDGNDWSCRAWTGIYLSQSYAIYRNNTIRNVRYGIRAESSNSIVERNTIDGFCDDGMRIGGPNSVYQDNVIINRFMNTDGEHSDMMQGSPVADGNNITIQRNYMCACTDPSRSRDTLGGVQGIFIQFPSLVNSLIVNNAIITTNGIHGISIGSGSYSTNTSDTKILNNTILQVYNNTSQPLSPTITMLGNNSNVLIRNNIARAFPNANGNYNISVDHNFYITSYNPDMEFVDYAHGNVRLRAGSHFINAGSNANAPLTDILGNSRGSSPDAGCYQYVGSQSNQAPNADAGPDQLVTDQNGSGNVQITLDGSGSSDPDGNGDIVSYVWTEGSTQIATGVTPTISLSVGRHTITLKVTDSGGLTSTDTVVITVESPSSSADHTPPSILALTATDKSVEIQFSEALDELSATNKANYFISNGIDINFIWLDLEVNRVTIYTNSLQQDGTVYTLTVANVKDTAGNPMPQTNLNYTYKQGLVGYWVFDNNDTSNVVDLSGHGNTGTLLNGVQYTVNGEANFTNTNNAVQVSTNGWDANHGTVSFWVYANKPSVTQFLFGHAVSGSSNRIQLYLNNGYLCLELGSSSTLNTKLLAAQTWYNIILTWDGTNYVIYVDGVAQATGTYSGLTKMNTIADIGNTGNVSARTAGFNGLIDEVRIYSKAITGDEVNEIAMAFLPIGDKTVTEGQNLSFKVRAKPDAIVNLAKSNLPGTPSFALNTFSWTPGHGAAGTYEVEFSAQHGTSTDFEKINITVIPDTPDLNFSNPIGNWKFDDASGDIALDSSATGNTGYLQNGLTWGQGIHNGAIMFSVPNDAVQIQTTMFDPNHGTIAMWAYINQQTMSIHYLFGHTTETMTDRIQLYLKYGNLCLGLGDSHETRMDIQQLQNQKWYHIALTWDKGVYNIYVNGTLMANGTYSGLTGFADHADIGNNGLTRDKGFDGSIDDVLVYERALTADDIAGLAVN